MDKLTKLHLQLRLRLRLWLWLWLWLRQRLCQRTAAWPHCGLSFRDPLRQFGRGLNIAMIYPICVLSVTLLLMSGAQQVVAQDEGAESDCQCRAPDGEMQDLGTVQCFNIVGTESLVRCEMSTNTPYWKKVEGVSGCPDA